ncbi:EcsC family protein [Adhaeribacter sp. BT258]|uniref:EcsC family protein n=1 Tax=Adhaeribacter terrigena TaxID=2793070 RepID=A0ABS1BY56_9BACT|nr:EcsC family protein [Adhaeribacter terrigena]MBK0402076.1 EcsC family protein [Adhaeribacter terrigena]
MQLSSTDLQDLKRAKTLLENPGLAIKIANLVGMPLDKVLENLPGKLNQKMEGVIQAALRKAADTAALSLQNAPGKTSSDKWHKLSAAVTGGLGGIFGVAALAVELPVSTAIMMRSITDIARSEGEDISQEATRLACIEVFAFGGSSPNDDAAEFGYYGVRAALAISAKKEGATILAKVIAVVAKRFSATVAQKVSAQAVPIIGAAGGAFINTIFMDHFQDMARGHFIIRRLERTYGNEAIRELYQSF